MHEFKCLQLPEVTVVKTAFTKNGSLQTLSENLIYKKQTTNIFLRLLSILIII